MSADLRAYCPMSRKQSPGISMALRQYVGSGGCQYGAVSLHGICVSMYMICVYGIV